MSPINKEYTMVHGEVGNVTQEEYTSMQERLKKANELQNQMRHIENAIKEVEDYVAYVDSASTAFSTDFDVMQIEHNAHLVLMESVETLLGVPLKVSVSNEMKIKLAQYAQQLLASKLKKLQEKFSVL